MQVLFRLIIFFLLPFLIIPYHHTGNSRLFPTCVSSVIERMNKEMTNISYMIYNYDEEYMQSA
ncbi:hypothetical protein BDV30DRAFT_123168 [Aspergillus minisclerotigenes]|uniref:Uncharacterized protein n=1 Tax=Aspergillus minisclerotigenes TaxID=656917 RepID=A0A5N6JID1_9EURO|nr:hypothetical protein BDV30DRAFT_123168 [Aspergillus minisclerotigenes]